MEFKTSLLVERQVPEFVRAEYPTFVSFLEAYYEFLENKQGTQKNDLLNQGEKLKYISDVDSSIDQFEENFFNTFAVSMPKDVKIDKALLIKNVLPLYLSKGSEKSFKLLFRMLFGEEVEITYPKDNILKASASNWIIEEALNISTEIYSYYTGDGKTDTFYILGKYDASQIQVYVNGELQSQNVSNFIVYPDYQKIVFATPQSLGNTINVYYSTVNESIFVNTKIIGNKSGATGIVDKVYSRNINNRKTYQLYVDVRNVVGTFLTGETLRTSVSINDIPVNVHFTTISELKSINVVDGGAGYNIGDPVIVSSFGATRDAKAFVSKVVKTNIDNIQVLDGGAGFSVNSAITIDGVGSPFVQIYTKSILSSKNTFNTFTIFSDVISDIDPANTLISNTNYALSGGYANPNVNTVIAYALANASYTNIGEIYIVDVQETQIQITGTPNFNANASNIVIPNVGYTLSNTTVFIDSFGSLGKLVIYDPGINYQKGDELVFTNKSMSLGYGAAAEVANVSGTGAITEVKFVPSKITGTASVSATNTVIVTGSQTNFDTELRANDTIMINGETKKVNVINSNTSLNVDSYFTQTFSGKPVRLYGKDLLGGQCYTQDKLPTITVNSGTGSNANIAVTAILGDGESFQSSLGTKKPGEILQISIYDSGENFTSIPRILLDSYGNGQAKAEAILYPSFEFYPGRWTTTDSIISSIDRKIQGKDYYVNYTYVLSSAVEFSKYKNILKSLIHPSGFKAYGEFNRKDTLTLNTDSIDSNRISNEQISGRVNVSNSSIYVYGTNTKFNIANTKGILTIGTSIAINSQIRIVNNIISNTLLTVSNVFTQNSNTAELIII